MANPTNPFNWQMPTSTDLVTDLPADFEVFGQAVATSMADLLGGTTGQVLSKASNTDMDFTWVAQDDSNAIQNAIVDAKGDLIAASAADTPARLAVGTNGQVLTADSTAATGLAWATASTGAIQAAGKNLVINGAFDNWQRGTSFTADDVFTADRWRKYRGATGATFTQQALSGLNNPYYLRAQRDSGNTSTATIYAVYNSESNIASQLRGLTATISFYARKGANYSATSNGLVVSVISGTGTDQGWLSYTGNTYQLNSTATLTSSWTKYTFTTSAFQANANQFRIQFEFAPTGTAGASDYVDISDVQLEMGSNATTFTRAGGTIQGELAACQRYYWRTPSVTAYGVVANYAFCQNSTTIAAIVTTPVTMRTTPTAIETSNIAFINYADSVFGMSSITLNPHCNPQYITVNAAISGGTAGHAGRIVGNNNANAYLGFSAEL
jgi:hypothetical protein